MRAARHLTANAASILGRSQAFRQLDVATQAAIVQDLSKISKALTPDMAAAGARYSDPYSFSLGTPEDFFRRRQAGSISGQADAPKANGAASAQPSGAATPSPRVAATETLAARAGALSDEINFPAFVASLVHGTFDAIVDATIRQMEAFADLVSAVAKDVDQFTSENVTPNQVRDSLAQQYPRDLSLEVPVGAGAGEPRLHARAGGGRSEEQPSPAWLADYGLEGQPLTDDLIEEQLIPAARRKVGENRLQMLATMVLLGMSRVNVKDGSISAKVRFRAAARDKAEVNYAIGADPGGPTWGERGSSLYEQHSTMVSTVGVNVQADTELKVELFGEVKINFVSETLPLERFADSARVTLLQRNARYTAPPPGGSNGHAAQPTPPAAAAPGAVPSLPGGPSQASPTVPPPTTGGR